MARPKKFEERDVVKAAGERFWTTGYCGTSLDDLLDATGLGRGSLYNSFGDKHGLYLHAFDAYCRDVVGATAAALEGPDAGAATRLRALLNGLPGAYDSGTAPAPRACFLAKATAEMAARDGEVAARARRAFADLERILVDAVTAAQRTGDIAATLDPRASARHILATMRGIEALAEAGVDQAMLRDAVTSLLTVLMPDSPTAG